MQIFSLKKYMTVVQTVDMPLKSINESLIVQQTLLVLFLSGVFLFLCIWTAIYCFLIERHVYNSPVLTNSSAALRDSSFLLQTSVTVR